MNNKYNWIPIEYNENVLWRQLSPSPFRIFKISQISIGVFTLGMTTWTSVKMRFSCRDRKPPPPELSVWLKNLHTTTFSNVLSRIDGKTYSYHPTPPFPALPPVNPLPLPDWLLQRQNVAEMQNEVIRKENMKNFGLFFTTLVTALIFFFWRGP